MKITFKCDYALKAMLHLAVNYKSDPVTSSELSEKADCPEKFMEQILSELKKGGYLESFRGKSGGYKLSRSPNMITLGELVRFIENYTTPIACTEKDYDNCRDISICVFRPIWQEVDSAISGIIDNISLEELVDRVNLANQAITYSI